MLDVHRIAPPMWAREPRVDLLPGGEVARIVFEQVLANVYDLVHDAVGEYINNDDLTFPEDDEDETHFPSRARMTGEYYLGDRSYFVGELDGVQCAHVILQARFVEKKHVPALPNTDYLGLDVRIAINKDAQVVVHGIDSELL